MNTQSIIVIPGAYEQTGEVFVAGGKTLADCVRRTINYFLDDLGVDDGDEIATILNAVAECVSKGQAKVWDFSSPDDSFRLLYADDTECALLVTHEDETVACIGTDRTGHDLAKLAGDKQDHSITHINGLDHASLVEVCEFIEQHVG